MIRIFIEQTSFYVLLSAILFFSGCDSKTSKSAGRDIAKKETSEIREKGVDMQMFREAALNGQTGRIKEMIPLVGDVDAQDENGNTALMFAGYNGHTEIVKLLLDKGSNVDHQNSEGRTALMYTASGPYPETVQLLLDRGAAIDVTDKAEHFTALMWAAAEGNPDVVKVLLKNGADASLKDVDGDTASSFARKNGHNAVADFIDGYKK